jgi:hypothetical protein
VKTESRRWKRTESGQLDRRTFIASAGVTAYALALPILPAKIEVARVCIIVSPNGADDTPGSLAHPLHSLDLALALSQSREKHGRFAVHADSLAMKRGFSKSPMHECVCVRGGSVPSHAPPTSLARCKSNQPSSRRLSPCEGEKTAWNVQTSPTMIATKPVRLQRSFFRERNNR